MTFKHGKFEDSIVMRSLEKVAKEKGMIKEDPITKVAESKLDLTISSSLMENILKLCAGLRFNGFNKQANELEANYLAYKKANTLYETSKEKGEDLIHDAHPKGSHKLEDVAGDDLAVIETILDEHMKLLKIVDKKPTGKLASSKSVINAVKNVLAQSTSVPTATVTPTPTAESLVENAIKRVEDAVQMIINKSNIGRGGNYMRSYVKEIKDLSMQPINVKNTMEMRSLTAKILEFASTGNKGIFQRYFSSWYDWAGASLSDKYTTLMEGIGRTFGGGFEMEEETLKKALNEITGGIKDFNKSIQIMSGVEKSTPPTSETKPAIETPPPPPQEPHQIVLNDFNKAFNLIGLYKARVQARNLENKDELFKWLDSAGAYIKKYQEELDKSEYKSDPEILNSYKQKLEAANAKLDAFKQRWLA